MHIFTVEIFLRTKHGVQPNIGVVVIAPRAEARSTSGRIGNFVKQQRKAKATLRNTIITLPFPSRIWTSECSSSPSPQNSSMTPSPAASSPHRD